MHIFCPIYIHAIKKLQSYNCIFYYFIEDQDYTKLRIGKTPDIHMSMYESY